MPIDQLARLIRDRRALLFAGAGVSMNLGLPSFSKLIDKLASDLGYAPEIFSTHGDYLELAEYYALEKGSLGPLRSWMDRTWHEGIDISKSKVHDCIVRLDFPLIYTTNYDSWLERAYEFHGKKYKKVSKASDFVLSSDSVTQIVKFHGDFDDDQSLVLTESQYFERLGFESPLDIRLRSDLLSRAVLFIGYSLSDINMRYMIYKMTKLWDGAGSSAARPGWFMFLTRPNPVHERVLEARGVKAIVSESDDPSAGTEHFLSTLLDRVENAVS